MTWHDTHFKIPSPPSVPTSEQSWFSDLIIFKFLKIWNNKKQYQQVSEFLFQVAIFATDKLDHFGEKYFYIFIVILFYSPFYSVSCFAAAYLCRLLDLKWKVCRSPFQQLFGYPASKWSIFFMSFVPYQILSQRSSLLSLEIESSDQSYKASRIVNYESRVTL